jgi:hypothetical protein
LETLRLDFVNLTGITKAKTDIMRLGYLLFTILLFCHSCKPLTALKKMNSEEATVEEWKNQTNKNVTFLAMAHIGKPEFYDNVQKTITRLKNEGYVVFYEGVRPGYISDSALSTTTIEKYSKIPEVRTRNADSLKRLIYNIKFKRMTGVYPDTASLSNLIDDHNLFRNKMVQPPPAILGITAADLNVDVTSVELVNSYEQNFGEIELKQIDFAVPFNEPLPGFRKLKPQSVNQIILSYRNDHLAASIQNSAHNKILVLYGLAHKKGTFEILKQLDATWKVLKN